MTEVRLKALPKQIEFLRANQREVLYSGAFGAGKTWALAAKCVMRAIVPGAREGLCRKHLVTLKGTTLKTLLDGDGALPPVLPRGTYEHNKSEKSIRITNGGEIVYFGMDDPDKAGSMNLSGCGVDEAVELAARDWDQLLGRIRLDLPELPNQVYGACNPGPPSHHLAERFGLALGHTPQAGCRAIQTSTPENTFLPTEYVESIGRFKGLAHKRYYLGLWVGSEGLVYDRWDRTVHCVQWASVPVRAIVGIDDGYTNPFVVVRIEVDSDGRAHVARERYETGLLGAAKVEAVRAMADGAEVVVVDPSAALLIAELRAAGISVREADNTVIDGIGRVQSRLDVQGDGRPRLTVDPTCTNTMREFETYEWRNKAGALKDEPLKESDHAMDAIRYAVNYLDAGRGVGLVAMHSSPPRETVPGESALAMFQRLRKNPDWGFDG